MPATLLERIHKLIIEDSFTWPDTIVNPRDAYYDDATGETFVPITVQDQMTALQHKSIRDYCRQLALQNEFAINAIENRISYTVGNGHKYRVVPKAGSDVDTLEGDAQKVFLSKCQTVIDKFISQNRWHIRQQEIRRRKDRDGEVFLRFFQSGENLSIRFVEPEHVANPPDYPDDTYGIRTDPDDIETVEGYWISGEFVDAKDIQHRKSNVDLSSKRGLSLLYPVRKNLKRAESLLHLMAVAANIQVAIAMIRKHTNATSTELENFVRDNADVTQHDSRTGKDTHHRMYGPGTILDINKGTDYEFPARGLNAYIYVKVLQAELRAVASRLCMPEYMLTSDASNANYSSTMVAEGPVVKLFERLQGEMVFYDVQILERALTIHPDTPDDVLTQVEIQVEPPRLTVRDKLKDAQVDTLLVDKKVMSRYTAALHNGLDPELEADRIQSEMGSELGIGDLFNNANNETLPNKT